MNYLIGLVGISLTFFVAWIFSYDRKNVKIKPIFLMLAIQFVLGFFLLSTSIGEKLILAIATAFDKLLSFAAEGVNFVFGGLANDSNSIQFFLNVLMPIIFISALIGILRYTKILPFIINGLGFLISKVNGMGRLESYNGAASIFLGQSEVFITIKDQLNDIEDRRLYTLSASALSSVSLSVVAAYMQMLKPAYVVTAIVLNFFGAFIISSIINPYTVTAEEDIQTITEENTNSFFEMLMEYIMIGFSVAMSITAMLIGFLALITMVNAIFSGVLGISFQQLLGYLLAPFAFFMGIDSKDIVELGGVMATKIISNEFVAMLNLQEMMSSISGRSEAVISTFLISFANFGGIGSVAGTISSLHKDKGAVVAKFGIKLLLGATLVSILTGTVVGLLY